MSGRIKGAPKSPEEERAELRQLTRELHEAAQDARGAARELRAEREKAAGIIEDMITELVVPLVNEAVTEINGHFNAGVLAAQGKFAEVDETLLKMVRDARECAGLIEKKAMDVEARLAGFSSREDALAVLQGSIAGTIATLAREEVFISDVAAKIAESVGTMMDVKHPRELQHMKRKRHGQILVATEEGLADYVAAGGDPGIVLRA